MYVNGRQEYIGAAMRDRSSHLPSRTPFLMNPHTTLFNALTSQVGRKILTGVTGVLLALFVVGHLAGNLQLLLQNPDPFNRYGAKLHSFGILLYVVEIGLAATILLHAYIGTVIYARKKRARKGGYEVYKSKGDPSRQTLGSRTMIFTGIVLLVFLVIHLIQFRFGPRIMTMVDGAEVHDLHRLVRDLFANVWWVIGYSAVMILLGFHLRHGIWSAFQSLGALKPRFAKSMFGFALILGLLLAVGFLILPIVIYLRGASV